MAGMKSSPRDVLLTTNGGETWSHLPLPDTIIRMGYTVNSLAFPAPNVLIVHMGGGGKGVVLRI